VLLKEAGLSLEVAYHDREVPTVASILSSIMRR